MLIAAYLLFLGNFLFGLFVRLGVIPAARFRIVHRVLYASVLVSLAIAAAVYIVSGIIPWFLFLVGAVLLAMPRFPGRALSHAVYAVVCLVVYTAVVLAM